MRLNHLLPWSEVSVLGRHMILGIYGYQDSGKTTMVEALVRALTKEGYRVASVKHSSRKDGVDAEGKDTWRHWKAGSDPVVFMSESETSTIKHSRIPVDDVLRTIAAQYHPDVIVVEGFKDGPFKKVAVGDVKPTDGTVMTNPTLDRLLEYAEAEVAVERILGALPGLDCAKCGLDCESMAREIAAGRMTVEDCVERPTLDVEVSVGESRIPMGKFASEIVNGTVMGMLGSLKGFEPGGDVHIHIRARSLARKKRTRNR